MAETPYESKLDTEQGQVATKVSAALDSDGGNVADGVNVALINDTVAVVEEAPVEGVVARQEGLYGEATIGSTSEVDSLRVVVVRWTLDNTDFYPVYILKTRGCKNITDDRATSTPGGTRSQRVSSGRDEFLSTGRTRQETTVSA